MVNTQYASVIHKGLSNTDVMRSLTALKNELVEHRNYHENHKLIVSEKYIKQLKVVYAQQRVVSIGDMRNSPKSGFWYFL